MGLFDKLKENFGGDDKPKSFQVTFTEKKMGMTISAGRKDEALVTGGESRERDTVDVIGCCCLPEAKTIRMSERGQRVRLTSRDDEKRGKKITKR